MTNNYRPPSPFDLSSSYGYRNDPKTKEPHKFHSGQDFRAPAGTPIPTAASGVVVYSGFNDKLGNVVIIKNDTGDYSLYSHLQDGDRAQLGQRIWPEDTIGRVGNTGERTTGPHLHYSIIGKNASAGVENPNLSHRGGPIGVALNEQNTKDPSQYDNYDPTPSYLDQSQRAAEIMSSGIAAPASGISSPDTSAQPFFSPFGASVSDPNPFADRFGKWGSVPLPNAPAASGDPASFADRFNRWDLRAPSALGNFSAPAPQVAPNPGKRAELDDNAPVRVLSRIDPSPPSGDTPAPAPARHLLRQADAGLSRAAVDLRNGR